MIADKELETRMSILGVENKFKSVKIKKYWARPYKYKKGTLSIN